MESLHNKEKEVKSRQIKKLRSLIGISQRRFAALLGVSASTYEGWESGRIKPTSRNSATLESIMRACGKDARVEIVLDRAARYGGINYILETGLLALAEKEESK